MGSSTLTGNFVHILANCTAVGGFDSASFAERAVRLRLSATPDSPMRHVVNQQTVNCGQKDLPIYGLVKKTIVADEGRRGRFT